jgi:hypothetical protein
MPVDLSAVDLSAAAASLAACRSLQSVNFTECPNVTHAVRLRWQRA